MAYLTMTSTFSFLRLLPRTDRDREVEILVLRHQLEIVQRQVARPAFTPEDRLLLAGLLHRLPPAKLRHLTLVVRPDTILRWHHNLLRHRHVAASAPRGRGRPRGVRSIRVLVLRPARESSSWGYRRLHGELATLGIKVAASTIWELLKEHGIDPCPERTAVTWSAFLRSQAEVLPACDFFEVRTLTGARLYVLTVIEHATRRVRVLGVTAHPPGRWVTPLGRNLVMDLRDVGSAATFLLRDRDATFTAAFDAVPADAPMRLVKSGVRMPRMNSIMERWIQTCRRELLERTLICNQHHLLQVLREFEIFYNEHRPHRALRQAAPLRPLPDPSTDPARITPLDIHRHDRLGGVLKEYQHAA